MCCYFHYVVTCPSVVLDFVLDLKILTWETKKEANLPLSNVEIAAA
jgi:hypothetical protein